MTLNQKKTYLAGLNAILSILLFGSILFVLTQGSPNDSIYANKSRIILTLGMAMVSIVAIFVIKVKPIFRMGFRPKEIILDEMNHFEEVVEPVENSRDLLICAVHLVICLLLAGGKILGFSEVTLVVCCLIYTMLVFILTMVIGATYLRDR